MKSIAWAGILIVGTLAITACGSSSSGETLINPENGEELAKGLSVKVGGVGGTVRSNKDAPIPGASNNPDAPSIQTAPSDDLNVANGDTAKTDIVFNSTASLSGLFAKIVGADSYVEFALSDGSAKASNSLSIDITVPSNILDGRFCIEFVARDVNSLVSEPTLVCYQIRSDRDDENSAAQIRSQLQGSWLGICDSAGSSSSRSMITISANNFSDTTQFFEGASCSGTASPDGTDMGTFVLGDEINTASGLKAREFDVTDDAGETTLDIVRIQGGQLFLGVPAAGRSTQLDFDRPYSRQAQDSTPLGQQTWSLVTSIKGLVNGQDIDQILSTFEVSGLDVPQNSGEGQVEAETLAEAYGQALEQACDGANGFQGDTNIANFSFTPSGNGGVGSVFLGQIDIFIAGVCSRNGSDDSRIDVDARFSYRFERIS